MRKPTRTNPQPKQTPNTVIPPRKLSPAELARATGGTWVAYTDDGVTL